MDKNRNTGDTMFVAVAEFRTNESKYLALAAKGTKIVVTKHGDPVAAIVSMSQYELIERGKRAVEKALIQLAGEAIIGGKEL